MILKSNRSVVFFIDRSLGGRYVAQALRYAGAQVETHDQHFAMNTPDVDWLAEAGRRGWVVLSKDGRIRRNRIERDALHDAGVGAFLLTHQGLTGSEMATLFCAALPGMISRAHSQPVPFIYTISRSGQFSLIN